MVDETMREKFTKRDRIWLLQLAIKCRRVQEMVPIVNFLLILSRPLQFVAMR